MMESELTVSVSVPSSGDSRAVAAASAAMLDRPSAKSRPSAMRVRQLSPAGCAWSCCRLGGLDAAAASAAAAGPERLPRTGSEVLAGEAGGLWPCAFCRQELPARADAAPQAALPTYSSAPSSIRSASARRTWRDVMVPCREQMQAKAKARAGECGQLAVSQSVSQQPAKSRDACCRLSPCGPASMPTCHHAFTRQAFKVF